MAAQLIFPAFPPGWKQRERKEGEEGGGGGTIYATNRGTKAARTCAAGRGTSRSQADLQGTMSQTSARGASSVVTHLHPYPLQTIDLERGATRALRFASRF